VPTEKNALCATFLPDHGFRQDGEQWRLPLADAPIFPAFIKRVDATGEAEQAA
jgi:hypothetical protein